MVKAKKGGKVRDKWRDKKWVVVKAPSAFGHVPVAYIPITDDKKAIGRVIETTLFDLWRSDPQQHTIKLYFQIDKIENDTAYTHFKGHEYAKEFLRSLIRRGSSLVNYINDFTTLDGYKFRVSTTVFTQRKVNTSRKKMVRRVIKEVLNEEVPTFNFDQFIQAVVGPKLNADLLRRAKAIIGIRQIAVTKTKLLAMPQQEVVSIRQ